jgi:hypothetical protein
LEIWSMKYSKVIQMIVAHVNVRLHAFSIESLWGLGFRV